MGKCIRCLDGELIQRPINDEDYDLYKCYDCPECGTIHEVYLLDESERHLYPKYNPEEEAMFVDSINNNKPKDPTYVPEAYVTSQFSGDATPEFEEVKTDDDLPL